MKKLFYSMLMLCAMFATTNVSAQEAAVIFEESFETSLGDFTVEGDAVWDWSAERKNPSARMSPVGKTVTVGKTYLVSPVIANGTQSSFTFKHGITGLQKGGFENVGKVCVREEGSETWTVLEGLEFPMGMKQLFGTEIESGVITIPAEFDNKNIQVAFCADPIDDSYEGNWFVNTIVVKSVGVSTSIDCIENVELDVNAPMFNVAGQKVNASYKGIVLQNGKKFFNK